MISSAILVLTLFEREHYNSIRDFVIVFRTSRRIPAVLTSTTTVRMTSTAQTSFETLHDGQDDKHDKHRKTCRGRHVNADQSWRRSKRGGGGETLN